MMCAVLLMVRRRAAVADAWEGSTRSICSDTTQHSTAYASGCQNKSAGELLHRLQPLRYHITFKEEPQLGTDSENQTLLEVQWESKATMWASSLGVIGSAAGLLSRQGLSKD
jgi:hypothetical protein